MFKSINDDYINLSDLGDGFILYPTFLESDFTKAGVDLTNPMWQNLSSVDFDNVLFVFDKTDACRIAGKMFGISHKYPALFHYFLSKFTDRHQAIRIAGSNVKILHDSKKKDLLSISFDDTEIQLDIQIVPAGPGVNGTAGTMHLPIETEKEDSESIQNSFFGFDAAKKGSVSDDGNPAISCDDPLIVIHGKEENGKTVLTKDTESPILLECSTQFIKIWMKGGGPSGKADTVPQTVKNQAPAYSFRSELTDIPSVRKTTILASKPGFILSQTFTTLSEI